jgi:poly-gamma-glutamate synthesis protein (capsule biosynthesis protein)
MFHFILACGSAAETQQTTEPPIPALVAGQVQAVAPAPKPELTQPLPEEPTVPVFTSSILPLSAETQAAMLETGVWKEGCPVPLDGLSELHLAHHSLDGVQEGLLITATVQAEGLVQVFATLFENQVVVEKMRPAHEYGGDDHKMMADNTTSAFNCRPVEGGAKYSEHSYGHAVDFNPLWNPYVRGERVQPPGGVDYLDRTVEKSGLVRDGDVVVQAFAAIGWKWGGLWSNSKDYQHFSATGK